MFSEFRWKISDSDFLSRLYIFCIKRQFHVFKHFSDVIRQQTDSLIEIWVHNLKLSNHCLEFFKIYVFFPFGYFLKLVDQILSFYQSTVEISGFGKSETFSYTHWRCLLAQTIKSNQATELHLLPAIELKKCFCIFFDKFFRYSLRTYTLKITGSLELIF